MSCIRRRTSFSTWAYIIKMCTLQIRVARISGRLDDDAEEAKSNQMYEMSTVPIRPGAAAVIFTPQIAVTIILRALVETCFE